MQIGSECALLLWLIMYVLTTYVRHILSKTNISVTRNGLLQSGVYAVMCSRHWYEAARTC